MNSIKLAIDLGGTNIRIARVENGQCTDHRSIPCPANEEASVVVDHLSQLIEGLIDDRVKGIGIGVPSIVDTQAGIVYDVANIAAWKEVPLKALLEEKFRVPVAVENDCNCFALGECMFGAGRDCSNMVGVTIGTTIVVVFSSRREESTRKNWQRKPAGEMRQLKRFGMNSEDTWENSLRQSCLHTHRN